MHNFDFRFMVLGLLLLLSCLGKAQKDSLNYEIKSSCQIASGTNSPFWFHSRNYGLNSTENSSLYLYGKVEKKMNKSSNLFDYGYTFSASFQTDKQNSNIYLHEYYTKLRLFFVDFAIGARNQYLGVQDSSLSSGGILFSQSSRPVPKITIGIEKFTTIPYTFDLLEIKGAVSHGWFEKNKYENGEFMHHKYAYLKLGGKFPVHLQYGLDHVAQWGGDLVGYGKQPSGFNDFLLIFMAKSGGSGSFNGEKINALGNHIISQSLRLDVNLTNFQIAGYWQNISEDAPVRFIGNTMNASDGLWGISIKNTKFQYISSVLYEYLNTTDQSGAYHDKDGIVYGGSDSYLSNYMYSNNWTYFAKPIGTPFILFHSDYHKVNNNRVQLHHIGLEGNINGYQYKFLSSFSVNYGTYYEVWTNPVKNTSMLLEVNKQFPKLMNLDLGCSFGADFGKLYGNSVGCMISIRKKGNLFNY